MLIAARWGKLSASIYSRNMLLQPTPHEHSYNYFQSDPRKWKVCFANRRQKRRHNQKPTCERLAIRGSPSPLPLPFQTSSLSQPPGARRHVSSSPRPCVPNSSTTCTGQCGNIAVSDSAKIYRCPYSARTVPGQCPYGFYNSARIFIFLKKRYPWDPFV